MERIGQPCSQAARRQPAHGSAQKKAAMNRGCSVASPIRLTHRLLQFQLFPFAAGRVVFRLGQHADHEDGEVIIEVAADMGHHVRSHRVDHILRGLVQMREQAGVQTCFAVFLRFAVHRFGQTVSVL